MFENKPQGQRNFIMKQKRNSIAVFLSHCAYVPCASQS